MRTTYAKVNIDNLYNNFCNIKRIIGNRKIIGVVKSNAYGHGLVEISRYLQEFGVDYLAVAFVSEGIMLRKAGISVPILVLVPENDATIEASVDFELDYAIEHFEVAKKISTYAKQQGKKARIHFYIDTGMGRDGIFPEGAKDLIQKCFDLPNIEPVGIMSHFASSDSDIQYTKLQVERFKKLLDELESLNYQFEIRHIANTGALFSYPESFFDAVRPGLALYGYTHNENTQYNFLPIMEVYSKVISIRKIRSGESVGYGRKFIAKENTTIATVPIGYGDGLPRISSDSLFCLIRGKKYKVVGGICMDEIMVDVGNDEIKLGDEVVILGKQGDEQITGRDLARNSQTIVYEVLTSISNRVPRIYVKNGT
ncbi:MAG: alanine racemase [Ignavibacteria bacterium]|nr:alanine racemase [Ignavibacteria bacterium]